MIKLKQIIVAIILCMICSSIFYLNVEYEQKIIQEADKTGYILNTTKNIIKREGNISDKTAKQYAGWIFDSAKKYAVDPLLILSVIAVESNFNSKSIGTTLGPIGLMQIVSKYHMDKISSSDELFDPKKNIQVGTQIIKEYSMLSNTTIETLLRYNGSLGKSTTYATKVMRAKTKFEAEIAANMPKT